MSLEFVVDLCGWAGMALLLSAYFLVSQRRVDGRSVLYQWMNFTGASLLGINTFYHGAYPATGLNAFWALIGLFALINLLRRARPDPKGSP